MYISNIREGLTGEPLRDAIKSSHNKRTALVEGFIYEQTINMIAADPGVGKSTISAQVAVEMAAGIPVFGVFATPRPLKVLYIQAERSIIELLERLEVIGKMLPLVVENLVITDAYQGLNLLLPEHSQILIECIRRDCPEVDVIILDPIYCMVAGGLKEDLPASAFTKAMSTLQRTLGATLWYNHHTIKATYTSSGEKFERDDPFYGSQWLKAHVTGSFHLKEDKRGVKLVRKKDNYRLLPDSISLDYDGETGLCSVIHEELPALDRVKLYMRARYEDKSEFHFNDVQGATKLCTRTLRECLMHSSIKGSLKVVSTKRNKHLYAVAQPPA